jgi:hypothetical protein
MRRAKAKEAKVKNPAEANLVLTLAEAQELLRFSSEEGARAWVKQYAAGAILPGGKFRVSRAVLLRVIEAGDVRMKAAR